MHLLTDRQGLPLGAVLSAGQRHESAFFTDLTGEVSVPRSRGRPRKRPDAVAGDRAYDADWIRQWCTDKGIESAIPARESIREGPGRPPTCDNQRYRDRNTVERCVGHLKERRRLVVRYEKKASHSEATASSHDPLGVRREIPEQIIIRRSLGTV
ncbi:transposase [Salinibacter ruber]|uniref:transposase n=1 Tax=Salinibacter ruber TaxID=146919 RepID=UPI003C6E4B09